MSMLSTIRSRRAALTSDLDPRGNLAALEESCVPSYCHPNLLAAAVAWWRLVAVASLCRRRTAGEPLLDFGAATGEVAHLLGRPAGYHFVESDERLAGALLKWNPGARRERLERLPARHFHTILALDSLEHNEDVGTIVAHLAESLRDDGMLIVSGPTETWLYELGRRIAGFGGHYHHHTVYDVERDVAARFSLVRVVRLPPVVPLFRISVWRLREMRGQP